MNCVKCHLFKASNAIAFSRFRGIDNVFGENSAFEETAILIGACEGKRLFSGSEIKSGSSEGKAAKPLKFSQGSLYRERNGAIRSTVLLLNPTVTKTVHLQ